MKLMRRAAIEEDRVGEESPRIALLCATAMVIPAAILNYMASLTYRSEIVAVEARNRADAV